MPKNETIIAEPFNAPPVRTSLTKFAEFFTDQVAAISATDEDIMARFMTGAPIRNCPEHVARLRKLNSRKAYRGRNSEKLAERQALYREQNREAERERTRNWKRANPDKVKEQKRRELDCDYHRPFVAIDAEGQDYPGEDIVRPDPYDPDRENVFRKHRTFLWGAKGWARDDLNSGPAGKDTEAHWLGTPDKAELKSRQILDWLITLPDKFGDVNFVMFSFGYDVSQILRGLPYKTVWEIWKGETYPEPGKPSRPVRGSVFYGPYAIKYMRGKFFQLSRFRDPDHPYVKRGEKEESELDYETTIRIDDAFGFYSSPFVKVVESLVPNGYATPDDLETIVVNKARRQDFADADFEEIKHYCELELTYLSKALTVLRDGFDKMDIRIRNWTGAGSAAGALILKQGLRRDHFSTVAAQRQHPYGLVLEDIRRKDPTKQQDAAHHAFFGGHIELLKQGYAPTLELFGYDIRSAYPSAMLDLPSMRGGKWTFPLADRKAAPTKINYASANILSMYKVMWKFPIAWELDGRKRPVPFYPLPYRTKTGAIIFPASGFAWLMRDDVLAAQRWIEAHGLKRADYEFTTVDAIEFEPADDVRPFEFVRELYDMRRELKAEEKRTGVYDIAELAIKLSINSIYGKFAQRVGGSDFYPPPSANPYYASAITAACRRRVIEAGVIEAEAIVMFATDGIVSTRELCGIGEVSNELGAWEFKKIKGGMFLQSGYYTYLDDDGKTVTKLRGTRKAHISKTRDSALGPTKIDMHDFLIEKVLAAWRAPVEPEIVERWMRGEDVSEYHPTVDIFQNTYVTAGSALSSRDRWKLAGRWATLARKTRVHDIGVKRDLFVARPDLYWTIKSPDGTVTEALRCRTLVPTRPSRNFTPAELSRPSMPDWIDPDGEEGPGAAESLKDLRELDDLMEGL